MGAKPFLDFKKCHLDPTTPIAPCIEDQQKMQGDLYSRKHFVCPYLFTTEALITHVYNRPPKKKGDLYLK